MSIPLAQYSLPDYLRLVGNQIQKAADNQDKTEIVRLLKLVRETCDAKIAELEPPAPVETITHDLDVSGTADTKEPQDL